MESPGSVLFPGDSASNVSAGESVNASTVSSCFTVADMVKAYEVMDAVSYARLVDLVDKCEARLGRGASMLSAAFRKETASLGTRSDITGSSGNSSSTGRGASKSRVMKQAKSWRSSGLPMGLCYTRLLNGSSSPYVARNLGSWPTLATLLKQPASAFRPLEDLSAMRLVGDSSSVHVVDDRQAGLPLLPAFARVAQGLGTAPGTFGAVVRAMGYKCTASGLKLTARTAVGGVARAGLSGSSSSAVPAMLGIEVSDGDCAFGAYRPGFTVRWAELFVPTSGGDQRLVVCVDDNLLVRAFAATSLSLQWYVDGVVECWVVDESKLQASVVVKSLFDGTRVELRGGIPCVSVEPLRAPLPGDAGSWLRELKYEFVHMDSSSVVIRVVGTQHGPVSPVTYALPVDAKYVSISRGGNAVVTRGAFVSSAGHWKRVEGFSIPLSIRVYGVRVLEVEAGDRRP